MYRLLIVDDEAMIRKGLSKIIKWKQIGFELAGAVEHAQAALEIINNTEIDVLLTDISMPEMSGLELIRTAKEKNPRLRSVVISGYSEFDYAVEAIRLRVETYILKPLDPHKITAVFEKLKAEMDKERRMAESADILQSEYELMRLLSSDSGMIRNIYGNQREEKLFVMVLIQTSLEENNTDTSGLSFMESRLIHEFYRSAGNLTAVITRSARAEKLVEELSGELEKRGLTYRIAVGRKVSQLSDVITLYLDVADELKCVRPGGVSFSRKLPFKNGTGSKTFVSEFIEAAEGTGQEKRKELTGRLFQALDELSVDDGVLFCVSILQGMIFYFKIANIRLDQFYSQSACTDGVEEQRRQDIKKEFMRTLDEILTQLKENSESLAVLVSYRTRQYINENYPDKELSLKYVANLLNVSYSYLSTEFTKTFGENFKTCLVNVRLEKARELLMTRRYKIYEIADMVGYGSSRYFTDAFKKKYGISPVDYLNRLHQGL